MSLYEYLRPHLPDKSLPIIQESINAISSLVGLEHWLPSEANYMNAIRIVHWGIPLLILSKIESINELKNRIAEDIISKGSPNINDFAELNGAALCVLLGARAIGHIAPTKNSRTPGYTGLWEDGEEVDIEVTCAQAKEAHIKRIAFANELSRTIHSTGISNNIILFIREKTEQSDVDEIMEAVKIVTPGSPIHKEDGWYLRAERPEGDPYTLIVAGQRDEAPEGWPTDMLNHCSFAQTVAGPDAKEPPPQARVYFGVPLNGYINPVQRKADRPQGRITSPFLIVIDVNNLSGAMSEFNRLLPDYFRIWRHISGVLAFKSLNSMKRIGWTWRLFVNHFADNPLPDSLVKNQEDNPTSMDSYYQITPEED